MTGKAWVAALSITLLTAGCGSPPATDSDGTDSGSSPAPIAALDYACDSGALLHIDWWADKVIVSFQGQDGRQDWVLPPARSGSGARYSDGEREVWEHHGEVRVSGPDLGQILCRKTDEQ